MFSFSFLRTAELRERIETVNGEIQQLDMDLEENQGIILRGTLSPELLYLEYTALGSSIACFATSGATLHLYVVWNCVFFSFQKGLINRISYLVRSVP